MTIQDGRLEAFAKAPPPPELALAWYDQIRGLLVAHRPAAATRSL